MERRLLNQQRKILYDILVNAGVNPSFTKWTNDQKSWTSSTVETLEAGLCYFLFNPDESDNLVHIKCRPAPNGGIETGEVNLSWQATLELFKKWSKLVKIELEQEDPWQKYSSFIPPETVLSENNNSPFTFSEAEEAISALTDLVGYIKETIPEYRVVQETYDNHFERMGESAKNGVGRIDWSNQFVGLIISLCIALSLSPEKASEIWNTWLQLITKLLPS